MCPPSTTEEDTTENALRYGDQNNTMDISNSEKDWGKIVQIFRKNEALTKNKNS